MHLYVAGTVGTVSLERCPYKGFQTQEPTDSYCLHPYIHLSVFFRTSGHPGCLYIPILLIQLLWHSYCIIYWCW